MNMQELRAQALRAAVEIEQRAHAPSHGGVLGFADAYMRWLLYGEVLNVTGATSSARHPETPAIDPPRTPE